VNSATLFNPASFGLAAKVWECLRRNPRFLDDFYMVGVDSEDEALSAAQSFRSRMLGNPIYAAFYDPLVSWRRGDPDERDDAFYLRRAITPEMSWDKIDSLVQGGVEDSLVRDRVEPVETPSPEKLDPRARRTFSEAEGRTLLGRLAIELDTRKLIFVPRVVWDPEHKRDILAEIGRLLGEPLAKDTRWLDNAGRALGTAADWRSYVVVCEWQKSGGLWLRKAANLAAWELYEGKSFGNTTEARVAAAKRFLERHPKVHKRRSKVLEQVKAIESAIEGIYPDFAPFVAARPRAR